MYAFTRMPAAFAAVMLKWVGLFLAATAGIAVAYFVPLLLLDGMAWKAKEAGNILAYKAYGVVCIGWLILPYTIGGIVVGRWLVMDVSDMVYDCRSILKQFFRIEAAERGLWVRKLVKTRGGYGVKRALGALWFAVVTGFMMMTAIMFVIGALS